MSEAWHAAKMQTDTSKDDAGRQTVEVAEAIKALQAQLADLRKIVQAARSSDYVIESRRRQ